jgi:hypothetical protein
MYLSHLLTINEPHHNATSTLRGIELIMSPYRQNVVPAVKSVADGYGRGWEFQASYATLPSSRTLYVNEDFWADI